MCTGADAKPGPIQEFAAGSARFAVRAALIFAKVGLELSRASAALGAE